MKILVCGSRDFNSYDILKNKMDELLKLIDKNNVTIIQGNAEGADKLAGIYALNNQINCITVPAKWNIYGKSAGFKRNIEMLDMLSNEDMVVAFSVNNSKGTQHTIDTALSRKIKVVLFKFRKK